METKPVLLTRLPGGFASTLSGGTRGTINLNRPWQPPLPINKEKCPFCTKEEEEVSVPGKPEGWRVLNNLFTPHKDHNLIIPAACWDAEVLQGLGGPAEIWRALQIVRLMAKDRLGEEIAVSVHVGSLAGQNLGHAHWHILCPQIMKPFSNPGYKDGVLIYAGQNLNTYAAGVRAGECIIVGNGEQFSRFEDHLVEELTLALAKIILVGNERFRSTQGNPPEYSIGVRVSSNGNFLYADYCPILNPWGSMEHSAAHYEGAPITLAWPHEVTAEHLRD